MRLWMRRVCRSGCRSALFRPATGPRAAPALIDHLTRRPHVVAGCGFEMLALIAQTQARDAQARAPSHRGRKRPVSGTARSSFSATGQSDLSTTSAPYDGLPPALRTSATSHAAPAPAHARLWTGAMGPRPRRSPSSGRPRPLFGANTHQAAWEVRSAPNRAAAC